MVSLFLNDELCSTWWALGKVVISQENVKLCWQTNKIIFWTYCFKGTLFNLAYDIKNYTGCSLYIVFFPRTFNILRPFPREYRTAICCTENGQPKRVTLHSDLQIRWVALLHAGNGLQWIPREETQFSLNTLYVAIVILGKKTSALMSDRRTAS